MSQQEDALQEQNKEQNKLKNEVGAVEVPTADKETESFLLNSVKLRVAVHEISGLVNTRLSTEALKHCIMLLEVGVHPKILAEVVLHILDAKHKKLEQEHGPLLP